ncbi:MAG: hypothetical protein E6J73_06135, partial [Deltaproteobacteria bacterium]
MDTGCGPRTWLKNGVTAVADHFSTRPGLSETKMKAILAAFETTGIRGVLTPSLVDQDFVRMISDKSSRSRLSQPAGGDRWQDQVLPVLHYVRKSSATSDLMLGPSSPFNCSDSLLREVVDMAERYDLGIHMHLLETRLQRWGAHKLYRDGVGTRLHKLGVLSRRLSAAHCVWLNEKEMDLMASSGASAVHNPASN